MSQNKLMKYDPATGAERPFPSHAAQWREYHGKMVAWLYNPWTGARRRAADVGSDPQGFGIAVPGENPVPAGVLHRAPTPPWPLAQSFDATCVPVYVASRASIPERSAMWRSMRNAGANITSTWIDKAGLGETEDMAELWCCIASEIDKSRALILYVEPGDAPLKGALVEVGMALGQEMLVAVVTSCSTDDLVKMLGSWVNHPNVSFHYSPTQAYTFLNERLTKKDHK